MLDGSIGECVNVSVAGGVPDGEVSGAASADDGVLPSYEAARGPRALLPREPSRQDVGKHRTDHRIWSAITTTGSTAARRIGP